MTAPLKGWIGPKTCTPCGGGLGTKSVSCWMPWTFFPPFDFASGGNSSNYQAYLYARSYFANTVYLKCSIRFSGYTGYAAVSKDYQFDPVTGICTITDNLHSTVTTSSAQGFALEYLSQYSYAILAYTAGGGAATSFVLTPTSLTASSTGGSASYYTQYAGSISITLSMPISYAAQQAAAATLMASVSLVAPANYTLKTGEVVTFDYPTGTKLAGASRIVSGIIVNNDGSFSEQGSAKSVYDLYGGTAPVVNGAVCANCVPVAGSLYPSTGPGFGGYGTLAGYPAPGNYYSPIGKQTVFGNPVYNSYFGTTSWPSNGPTGNLVTSLFSLATAVKGTYTFSRTAVLDNQPFNVPFANPPVTDFNGNVGVNPPPVYPQSISMVVTPEVAIVPALTGEHIYLSTDASPGGVVGLAQAAVGISTGAGATQTGAGASTGAGGGSGGL